MTKLPAIKLNHSQYAPYKRAIVNALTLKSKLRLRQVLVLKELAVYPNSFGVIPVNVIFNSED